MNICTITCHHAYNHGAMLQAYSLVTYLSSLGHNARIIDYRPSYQPDSKVDFKRVPKRYSYPLIAQLYRISKRNDKRLEQRRRDVYEHFFKTYLPITCEQYCSVDELRANPPEADLYIAGSDQIWNTSFPNGTDAAFYLDFGNAKRKISYAASFATEKLAESFVPFVKKNLKNLDAISVREESALRLLNQLGYYGELVVDPVFLLKKEQWSQLFNSDILPDEDYILTYDYENKNSSVGVVARRLAKLYGCKVYTVAPYRLRYADHCYVDIDPKDFISLINNARCVVSNSFHGSAFSIIFDKDFFVVNRKDGLNVRMHDLLDRYGLEGRLVSESVSSCNLMESIDYVKMKERLRQDIKASQSYLQSQIDSILR